MPSYSEDSPPDYDRMNSRVNYNVRESSTPSGPRGRVDSSDITHCGGCFGESEDRGANEGYPLQLDISEEEDVDKQPRSRFRSERLPIQSLSSAGSSPSPASLRGSPSTPHMPTYPRPHLLAYLQPDDFLRQTLPHSNTPSRRTRSSYQCTLASSSASNTTLSTTHINNDDEDSRAHIPYFTPSHTPSHRSAGTTEEEFEGGEPVEPPPYSSFQLYDAQYGRGVVEDFEQRFTEHDLSHDRGHQASSGA